VISRIFRAAFSISGGPRPKHVMRGCNGATFHCCVFGIVSMSALKTALTANDIKSSAAVAVNSMS
jgi:hypothetical protein